MAKDVKCAINELKVSFVREARIVSISSEFLYPGYWCVFVAYGHKESYPFNQFDIPSSTIPYAQAIKFPEALGGENTYPYVRCNEGKNYSTLAHLRSDGIGDDHSDVEPSNEMLSNVIQAKIPGEFPGKSALIKAIGELHDNVCSHGKSSGFSMSQFYEARQYHVSAIRFAVVDSGMGLLEELKRKGTTGVNTHEEAISWCIQEGNSTKKVTDEWVQRLPSDATSNPFGDFVETTSTENHHQGLGLHYFVKLVKDFHGTLQLATGNCALLVDNTGAESYITLGDSWQGVAISCCLPVDRLQEAGVKEVPVDIQSIMDKLRA